MICRQKMFQVERHFSNFESTLQSMYTDKIRIIVSLRFIFCIISILIVFVSCKKDDDTPDENEYLSDHSVALTYPLSTIQTIIALQAGAYPEAHDIIQHVKYGVHVLRVNYKTHYRDSVITASGLVCVPDTEGSFPVISFQNGTNAFHGDAPSVNPANSGYVVMELVASNGFIVLIPDYIGFGASSEILHPYYERESTNNAVIDLIRAFNELESSGSITATGNDSLFLLGYSQGGEATISAAEEIENDNPIDMDLIAVSAGGGGYNLIDFTNFVLDLETFPSPMYFPYFIYSHKVFGSITSPLSLFFNEPYASEIPGLFDGSHGNDEINDALANEISVLINPNLINNFSTGAEFSELRNALSGNSIEGWNSMLNIRLYHSTNDDNVPPSQSLNLYNEFIEAGSNPDRIKHIPMEGLAHGSGLFPWGISTINWFNSLRN